MSRGRDNRGPPSKRLRGAEWEDIDPSAVLHIRELPEHTLEIDLIRAFEQFGLVREVSMMPNRGQALLEFDDIHTAKEVVNRAKSESVMVANRRVKVNFSTSSRIVHRGENVESSASAENQVLLFTIYNALYPITVDVLYQICSPHGKVLRIVIFHKAYLQAMIEFGSVEDARRTKRNLNGADIYSGCCTVKAEYARPTTLSVTKNDNETWDYENPNPKSETAMSNSLLGVPDQRPSLLRDPSSHGNYYNDHSDYRNSGVSANASYGQSLPSHNGMANIGGASESYYGNSPSLMNSGSVYTRLGGVERHAYDMEASGGGGYGGGGASGYGRPSYDGGPSGFGASSGHGNGLAPTPSSMPSVSGGGMPQEGSSVIMVYGLNANKVNCDRVFNLFCIYGNVMRIKFLKSKEGSCMVQMGDPQSVERCIQNLNFCRAFDNKIQLQPSKQALIMDVPKPWYLADETPSFKDYSSSRNNRYVNVEMAAKNRITRASCSLHYWNCPPDFSESDMCELFKNLGAGEPKEVIRFPGKDKSSSGLIQWNSVDEALEAVMLANHTEIPYPEGRFPYLLKLSFSTASGDRSGGGGRGGGQNAFGSGGPMERRGTGGDSRRGERGGGSGFRGRH